MFRIPDHLDVASDMCIDQDTRRVHPCTLGSSMAQASFSTAGLTFSLLLTVLLNAHIARHTILLLVRNSEHLFSAV